MGRRAPGAGTPHRGGAAARGRRRGGL